MSQTAATWKPGTLAAYPIFPEPICPTPMNAILTLSLAPLRLPVKMEEVRAAAPAALRKSLRPVDACGMPLVVSGFVYGHLAPQAFWLGHPTCDRGSNR